MHNIFEKLSETVPANFESLDALQKLEAILMAADKVLQPEGDWILMNASMTIREMLQSKDDS